MDIPSCINFTLRPGASANIYYVYVFVTPFLWTAVFSANLVVMFFLPWNPWHPGVWEHSVYPSAHFSITTRTPASHIRPCASFGLYLWVRTSGSWFSVCCIFVQGLLYVFASLVRYTGLPANSLLNWRKKVPKLLPLNWSDECDTVCRRITVFSIYNNSE